MGLEEHLLQMFREDFEFHDEAPASHLQIPGQQATRDAQPAAVETGTGAGNAPPAGMPAWTSDGEQELKKIPFFVRGKARRNTERYAQERGVTAITVETLYDAKAHFGR
jgi:light-independent protochlorophyllide reductase subunit B